MGSIALSLLDVMQILVKLVMIILNTAALLVMMDFI
jgi:hypothetical protein